MKGSAELPADRSRQTRAAPATGVAVAGVSTGGRIERVTAEAATMLGHGREELLGHRLEELCVDPRPLQEAFRLLEARRQPGVLRIALRSAGGKARRLLLSIDVEEQGTRSYVLHLIDATPWDAREANLKRLALSDAGTGLPNRRMLFGTIRRYLKRRKAFSVVLIDGDHLKTVNDGYGHGIGDELIRQIGQRLLGARRAGDMVARIGGDEFVVILAGVTDPNVASRLAQRFLDRLDEPFRIHGHAISSSASAGVAVALERHRTARSLLDEADLALGLAKSLGRHRVEGSGASPWETSRSPRASGAIVRALVRKDHVLHLQPIVELERGTIVGFEAMVRIRADDGVLLPARQFLPVAEASGLMAGIGSWAIQEAIRVVGEWQERFPRTSPLFMTSNISEPLLDDTRFPAHMKKWLQDGRVAPGTFRLEVTEGIVLRRSTRPQLADLVAAGAGLVIDDFGRGFTSLTRLHELPFCGLKLDGGLTRRLDGGPREAGVIRGIVELAHSCGMQAMGAFVETEAQAVALRHYGCDLAQGYRFAPPMGTADVESLLAPDLADRPQWPSGKQLAGDAAELPVRGARYILVVEDSRDIREMLALTLRLHGHQVVCVANGEEALAHLSSEESPSLIFLDLAMPVMDGWTFRSRQAQDPTIADIPVVILSGVHDLARGARTLRADALAKPIDVRRLEETLARLCPPPAGPPAREPARLG